MLVELPRFKGLCWAFIFHVATDRLTLHYCVDRSPLRLTSECTHLPDLLWCSTCLPSCTVLMNMDFNCFLSYLLEGRSFWEQISDIHILYHRLIPISQTDNTVPEFNNFPEKCRWGKSLRITGKPSNNKMDSNEWISSIYIFDIWIE